MLLFNSCSKRHVCAIINTMLMGVYMKQQLIDDICLKLNELHIPFTLKENTYIYVNTEFYDVGYGTEAKIVLFDLSVFIDEANHAVFMYVKTADKPGTPAGGSPAGAGQSSSMFRKVRHVCYDPDGKVTVITVDLGDVSNTVKNTAFKYGWKFRTALNLNKPVKKVIPTEIKQPDIDESQATEPIQIPESDVSPATIVAKKTGLVNNLKSFTTNLFNHKKRS